MTNEYKQEIENFQNHLETLLEDAWAEDDGGNNEPIQKLHNTPIIISFGGQTLELAFGPTEYESILECLDRIKEEA